MVREQQQNVSPTTPKKQDKNPTSLLGRKREREGEQTVLYSVAAGSGPSYFRYLPKHTHAPMPWWKRKKNGKVAWSAGYGG